MKLRREDAEELVDMMVAIAEAVVSDYDYKQNGNPDFFGVDTQHARDAAVKKLSAPDEPRDPIESETAS